MIPLTGGKGGTVRTMANRMLVVFVIAALCVATPARAEGTSAPGTAVLEGNLVWRAPGNGHQPLRFANVIVVGTKRGSVSDESGRFRVVAVPAGTWRVKVTLDTYRPLDTLLTFAEHATTRLDAVLEPQPAGRPGDGFRGAERPSAELRRRLRRADVVRAFRLERMPDAPTDTSNSIGGVRIVASIPRDAKWRLEVRQAFGRERSWSRIEPDAVDLSELYGLRFHDAGGWVDVVVMPRGASVSVSEGGARSNAYTWDVNRGPVRRWFE